MTVGLSSLDKPCWSESCHAGARFVKTSVNTLGEYRCAAGGTGWLTRHAVAEVDD